MQFGRVIELLGPFQLAKYAINPTTSGDKYPASPITADKAPRMMPAHA